MEELRTKTVTIEDEGSRSRMAMKSLHRLGVINEKLLPYRPSTEEYQPAWNKYNVKIKKEGGKSDEEVARLIKEQDEEWHEFEEKWSAPNAPVNEQPDPLFYPWAHSNRILSYERLDVKRNDDESKDLATDDKDGIREADGRIIADNLRLALSDGHPVVFGFKYYEKWPFVTDFGPERYTLVRLKKRHEPPPEDIKKSHCVLAIGYTDDYVLCQNSWGSTWGPEDGVKDGLFHVPWSYVTDFVATTDFWIIKTIRPLGVTDKEDEKDAKAEAEWAAKKAKDEADKAAQKALETEVPAAAS